MSQAISSPEAAPRTIPATTVTTPPRESSSTALATTARLSPLLVTRSTTRDWAATTIGLVVEEIE